MCILCESLCARVMGTREVYEQKLQTGNLYHAPTIKPGLGTPRCPRCLSQLNSNSVLILIFVNYFIIIIIMNYIILIIWLIYVLFCWIQDEGEWTITPVLHDATAVVIFDLSFLLFSVYYLLIIVIRIFLNLAPGAMFKEFRHIIWLYVQNNHSLI